MGTTIRPELSEKNPYWIERHRYYELKHFCLQYPIWKKAYAALDGLSRRPSDLEVFSKKGEISDPMWKKELIKNKIYAVILMCGGALAIPWCDGDATFFLFSLMMGIPLFFAKENWIYEGGRR